jgi:F0F1-type ATP synthase epsilon subunit
MVASHTFRCIVTTEEESVLSVDASSVILPTTDGMMGVLVNRAPFIAAVGKGKLMVRTAGKEETFTVSGGAAHMRDNVLTIVAEQCARV